MSKNILIAVVGSINADVIAYADKTTQRANYAYGSNFEFNLGGKSLNVALTSSILTKDVALIARIGNDIFGSEILERLSRRGVITEYIRIDENAHTGIGHVRVDNQGQYDTIVVNGANWNLGESEIDAFLEDGYIPKFVVFNFETDVELLKKIIPKFKSIGSKIVINFSPIVDDMRDLLIMADVAVLNMEEAQQILNTSEEDSRNLLLHLKKLGPDIVVITLGAEGAASLDADGVFEHEPAKKVNVRNTIGAGDGFLACLVYSLAKGIDIKQSMMSASMVGETICSKNEASLDKEDLIILQSESPFFRGIPNSLSTKG